MILTFRAVFETEICVFQLISQNFYLYFKISNILKIIEVNSKVLFIAVNLDTVL